MLASHGRGFDGERIPIHAKAQAARVLLRVPATCPRDTVDHVTVLARHKDPKPSDPVRINLEKFRVVKADFDPKKIEGGKRLSNSICRASVRTLTS